MAAPLEPAVNIQAKQNNFKRKLSQENNNISPSNPADQDTDDRQWPAKNNRPFYQNKNKNSFNDDGSNNQDYENFENENGNNSNNFNQFNNNNNNFNNRVNNNRGNNNNANNNRNRGNLNNKVKTFVEYINF